MGSKDKEFNLNSEYRKGTNSIIRFAKIIQYLQSNENKRVLIDLTDYSYIHPYFAVLIAAIPYIGESFNNGITIRFSKQNEKCNNFLQKTGILKHYLHDNGKSNKKSVDFKIITKEEDFPEAIYDIINKFQVELSQEVKDILFSKLYEIFSNSFTHSGKKQVFCCGALDSQQSLSFSIYDAGRGIPDNVNEYLKSLNKPTLSSEQALHWAWERGNSTLNGKTDYPRGAGLHLLESFVKSNQGDIIMVSGNSYCKISNEKRSFRQLEFPLLGTLFCMSIKKDKNHKYIIKDSMTREEI